MNANLDNLAKHAGNMNMEDIEKRVKEEIAVPEDLMKDIGAMIQNNAGKAEKLKKEMDLREDQVKLRRCMKLLNDQLTLQIQNSIHAQQK
jgi:hypothetical protein